MSSKAVTLEQITVLEHSNADALELAKVGEYRAVIPKGVYQTGDWAIYIPEGVVLPDELIEELGLVGKLAGKDKNRVKAVRLRGELSQGIVCKPKKLEEEWEANTPEPGSSVWSDPGEVIDFSDLLGIVPWVPPVPASMSGDVESAPRLVRWIDIENIKRFPDIFIPGEEVIATEKIHGTCFCSTFQVETNEFMVSSKGLGGKNLALKEDKDQNDQYRNIYWRMARLHRIEELARSLAEGIGTEIIISVAIFGEVYGQGIQDLQYEEKEPTLAIFDIKLLGKSKSTGELREYWLDYTMLHEIINLGVLDKWSNETNLRLVPLIYEGPYDYDGIAALSEVTDSIAAKGANVMEGLVVRAVPERQSDILGGRAIAKFINPNYLTRKGGTEYE